MHREISAEELSRRLGRGESLNILDVRDEMEYHTFNIGGKNIPLHEIVRNPSETGFSESDELIVICSAGLRSKTAVGVLTENGFRNVLNLSGGLRALHKIKQ